MWYCQDPSNLTDRLAGQIIDLHSVTDLHRWRKYTDYSIALDNMALLYCGKAPSLWKNDAKKIKAFCVFLLGSGANIKVKHCCRCITHTIDTIISEIASQKAYAMLTNNDEAYPLIIMEKKQRNYEARCNQ